MDFRLLNGPVEPKSLGNFGLPRGERHASSTQDSNVDVDTSSKSNVGGGCFDDDGVNSDIVVDEVGGVDITQTLCAPELPVQAAELPPACRHGTFAVLNDVGNFAQAPMVTEKERRGEDAGENPGDLHMAGLHRPLKGARR